MNHKDLARIYAVGYISPVIFQTSHFLQMGDESDISYLLKTHKTRVVVDEDGGEFAKFYHFSGPCLIFSVGEIVCEDGTLSSQAATMDSPQDESRGENGTLGLLVIFLYQIIHDGIFRPRQPCKHNCKRGTTHISPHVHPFQHDL